MGKKGALTVLAIVLLVVSVLWLFVVIAISTGFDVVESTQQEVGGNTGTGIVKVNVVAPTNNLGAGVMINVVEKGG